MAEDGLVRPGAREGARGRLIREGYHRWMARAGADLKTPRGMPKSSNAPLRGGFSTVRPGGDCAEFASGPTEAAGSRSLIWRQSMSFLSRWRIGRRLSLAFAVVVALTVVSAVFAQIRLAEVRALAHE